MENRAKTSTSAGRVSGEPSERPMTWRSSVFRLQLSVRHTSQKPERYKHRNLYRHRGEQVFCEVFKINHTLKNNQITHQRDAGSSIHDKTDDM